MESTALAIVFIIGKAAIWLALPLALGLWELRRHRRMMAAEARDESEPPTIPGWLRASGRDHRAPRRTAGDDRVARADGRARDEGTAREAA